MSPGQRLRRIRDGVRGNTDRIWLHWPSTRALLARSRVARRVYLATSSAFAREALTTLAGLDAPADPRDSAGLTTASTGTHRDYYWARRAVHRMEKGLISQPRRPVFARDYAPKLVDLFLEHHDEWDAFDPDLVTWCNDVLTEYFEVVETVGEPALAEAARRFSAWDGRRRNEVSATRELLAPYPAIKRPPVSIDYDDLLDLARRRRSVRWFRPDPVPRELLDKAVELAGLSPTACNRQPFTFLIADAPAAAAEMGGLAMGTAGFSHQFPCCIAVVGEQRAFAEVRDRHLIYIDSSLAVMSLLLALETLGLSACTINWPDIGVRDKAIRERYDLRRDQQTVMLIAVGYADPDGGVPSSAKKSIDQLRRYVG